MNPVIGQCPICGDQLEVTRLHCRQCDTVLEGHFALGRLYHLSPEQLRFAEIFIKNEGKLTRVGQELSLSYPTVRARLEEVIHGMGYPVGDDDRITEDDRRDILAQVSSGALTAEEAVQLLRGDG